MFVDNELNIGTDLFDFLKLVAPTVLFKGFSIDNNEPLPEPLTQGLFSLPRPENTMIAISIQVQVFHMLRDAKYT
jgi:hypothetical protein